MENLREMKNCYKIYWFLILLSFFQKEIVLPLVYAAILGTAVNLICCYLFMFHFKYGIRYGNETFVLLNFATSRLFPRLNTVLTVSNNKDSINLLPTILICEKATSMRNWILFKKILLVFIEVFTTLLPQPFTFHC